MSSVYQSCAKIVLVSGISAVVYLSAGVALYYFYKKHRDRGKHQRQRSPRKLKRQESSCGAGRSSSLKDDRAKMASSSSISDYCSSESDDGQSCDEGKLNNKNNNTDKTKNSPQKLKNEKRQSIKSDFNNTWDKEGPSDLIETEKPEHLLLGQETEPILPISTSCRLDDNVKIESPLTTSENGPSKSDTPDSTTSSSSSNNVIVNYSSCVENGNLLNHSCDGEVSKVMMRQSDDLTQLNYTKKPTTDSPSMASDGRSEGSQDSGKGQSMGITSSMSPVDELIEIPPMYEFEVPQDIVGLLIGRKGTTIKYFTDESGAHIVIRHHYYSDKHKICTIEGTREQINKCLRLIRHKFPPSRFPELKLTPLLPPPVVSPNSPILDTVVNLSLPEGVRCEVVLSSMVDAGHFFVQQPTHPTFPSLARLDQYMLAVYSQPAGVPGLPRPIEVGIICAAPVLAGWYRAQTICVYDETDEVLVKFVDYGGYCKISAADLRQIRSDFMNLPFEAVECCLAHVKPIDEKEGWSAEANALFEENVHGRVAEALLVNRNCASISMVELYCIVDNETVMINRLMVEKGHAKWIEDPE